jgi:hypothetical protein
MKLTLKGCEHRFVESWGQATTDAQTGEARQNVTCLSCYERLVIVNGRLSSVIPVPAKPCDHAKRRPVSTMVTKGKPYRDALCGICGVVQRHPDGRGVWTDVRFYGYLIKEEP